MQIVANSSFASYEYYFVECQRNKHVSIDGRKTVSGSTSQSTLFKETIEQLLTTFFFSLLERGNTSVLCNIHDLGVLVNKSVSRSSAMCSCAQHCGRRACVRGSVAFF